MPYQVSWQSVSMKSQTPMHVFGVEAAAAGAALASAALAGAALVDAALVDAALVGTSSAAQASAPHNAPAAARIIVARMRNFVMPAPMLQHDDRETVERQLQGTDCVRAENSDRVVSSPQ